MTSTGKFMLIGDIEAGKSTLLNALFNKNEPARKTQAIEFEGQGLDTPGEYFSHPRLYSALLSMAADVATLVYVHPANCLECRLPPGLLDVYSDKRVIGVVTKTDLADAQPDAVETMMRAHGINGPIFRTDHQSSESLIPLRTCLLGGNQAAPTSPTAPTITGAA